MKSVLSWLCFTLAISVIAEERVIPPEFPRVQGVYQMTDDWTVTLPSPFARRFEEGDLVLWRKGLTCWTVVYDLKEGETPQQRFDWLKKNRTQTVVERWELADGLPLRFAYLLHEKENSEERWALYTFTVGDFSHVMMAIYFDKKEDIQIAREIWMSITQRLQSARTTSSRS